MWRHLLSLLVPPCCCACGAATRGDPLCGGCRRALPWLAQPRCPRCGLPAPCGRRCPAAGSALDASWAPLAHGGPARQLVVALKFRGALRVADAMAGQIAANAPAGLLEGVLVPVPSHPARRAARGFDHAECLARALRGRTGLELRATVRRGGAPARQLGAGRAERLDAGRLALSVRGPIAPRVVLVDDVHTTGATLAACALVLREAGCEHVVAVTYTRALR